MYIVSGGREEARGRQSLYTQMNRRGLKRARKWSGGFCAVLCAKGCGLSKRTSREKIRLGGFCQELTQHSRSVARRRTEGLSVQERTL